MRGPGVSGVGRRYRADHRRAGLLQVVKTNHQVTVVAADHAPIRAVQGGTATAEGTHDHIAIGAPGYCYAVLFRVGHSLAVERFGDPFGQAVPADVVVVVGCTGAGRAAAGGASRGVGRVAGGVLGRYLAAGAATARRVGRVAGGVFIALRTAAVATSDAGASGSRAGAAGGASGRVGRVAGRVLGRYPAAGAATACIRAVLLVAVVIAGVHTAAGVGAGAVGGFRAVSFVVEMSRHDVYLNSLVRSQGCGAALAFRTLFGATLALYPRVLLGFGRTGEVG